jgi:hypothetical protein
MEAVLAEHREHEKSLRNTLLTAQRLSDDIKTAAEKEADRVVREAAMRSQHLIEKAESRLEDVQREIDGLKLKRRDVETSLESTIQTLRNSLDTPGAGSRVARGEDPLHRRSRIRPPAARRPSTNSAAPRLCFQGLIRSPRGVGGAIGYASRSMLNGH